MEGNKDDALKCLRIGKQAMEAGDRSRALKFISKARRLDPTLPVDDLLSEIEKESNGPGDPQPQGSSGPTNNGTSESLKPSDQPSVRHRGPSSLSASSASMSASYMEEQIAIVRQIKKKKDYYEILGVEKSCTVEDVRKAYRKLIFQCGGDIWAVDHASASPEIVGLCSC